jgi:hypothetical protein
VKVVGLMSVAVLIAAVAACGGEGDTGASASAAGASAAPSARPVLMPAGTEPFRVRGAGFRAREHVRLAITPSAGTLIVRRLHASRAGTFAASFEGVDACAGVEGVATGGHGTRASFQLSSLGC